ncbi:MAG TPA: prenyltransferase/squalene oxidase repeat-containing protein [Pirellulales bacterium]|nr:prenyltransferase/squalene oxidase repeat-containing protein [Pirellulales bacterium]
MYKEVLEPRHFVPRWRRIGCALGCWLIWSITSQQARAGGPDAELYARTVERAIKYLGNQGQAEDGSYSKQAGPGVTALATTALLRHGRSARDPVVAKSLKYLEGFVQPDGSVHPPKSRLPNYETCLAMVCFREANADGRYDEVLRRADGYVKGVQKGGEDGKDESDVAYGGAGYGKDGRPDLSNTHFLVEALRAAGNEEDDESLKKALVFISRCQNLETEHNATEYAALVNDGGFYYTPAGGTNPEDKTANGGLRSYGSMTYAGLKSMLFAGVGPDDPRVKAALDWVKMHYDLGSNPGMGQAGLYYYYHLFAKALDAIGDEVLVDGEGSEHEWRRELVDALAERQAENGSWSNPDARWLEGDPNLCTGFALLALSYCKPTP